MSKITFQTLIWILFFVSIWMDCENW